MHRLVFFLMSLAVLGAAPAGAGPEGQMTLATTVSFAARWFDPAEAEGIITPFIYYYALHDALVKPLPGNPTLSQTGLRSSGQQSVRPSAVHHTASQQNRSRLSQSRSVHSAASICSPHETSEGEILRAKPQESKVLKDLVEHHAKEEEKEMFPRAKKLMDREELLKLGERLGQAKTVFGVSARSRVSQSQR